MENVTFFKTTLVHVRFEILEFGNLNKKQWSRINIIEQL